MLQEGKSRKDIAKAIGISASTIYKHLANIFDSEELKVESTISKMETAPFLI